ncbi:MAG: ATP-binding cassette domain-containing protein [Alkaliphilus sp.]
MNTIEIKSITKKYGKTMALNDINLTIKPNLIYGLLGRNGAGKTTLLNLISNRIFPTSGEILLGGEKVIENDRALNKMFYMTEANIFPNTVKVKDAYKWTREIYKSFDMKYANELSDKFELNVSKKIKQLSTGYTSIFKAIIALASSAEVLLLDEPVLGLDAYHRDMFYEELIKNYSENPKTIIISTHLIAEVADVLEEIIIIKRGKIIKQKSSEGMLSTVYTVSGENNKVEQYLKNRKCIGAKIMGGFKIVTVLEDVKNKDVDLANKLDLKFGKAELQKLFIDLTGL